MRRAAILACVCLLFPGAARAKAKLPQWALYGFSADGKVALFEHQQRTATRVVFAENGAAFTMDVSISEAEHLLPKWGWASGSWFDSRYDYEDQRKDALTLGALSFRLVDGRLALVKGRKRVWSAPAKTEWTRLGFLGATLGPGNLFLVMQRQVDHFDWRLTGLYRARGGNLGKLVEVPGALAD